MRFNNPERRGASSRINQRRALSGPTSMSKSPTLLSASDLEAAEPERGPGAARAREPGTIRGIAIRGLAELVPCLGQMHARIDRGRAPRALGRCC